MERVEEGSRYIAYIKLNQEGCAKAFTKAFLERFSLSAEQLAGRPVYEVLGSDELRQFLFLHREKAAGQEFQSECLIPIAGKRKEMVWCLVEMLTKNKEEVLYFHDRSESYQAQMILESVLMLESDLFVFFDTRECVLQCSEEAVRIFGFPNRLETFGLHYTTFFHNRLPEQVLMELFDSLGRGIRYEGNAEVKYKGGYKYYEIRAFNVMMKNRKAGIAICLKEVAKPESYVSAREVSILQSSISPYVVRTQEEKFEPFFEMELAQVREKLRQELLAYRYNRCQCMIEYLLQYGSDEIKEECMDVKGYLEAFCYEQAAEVLK